MAGVVCRRDLAPSGRQATTAHNTLQRVIPVRLRRSGITRCTTPTPSPPPPPVTHQGYAVKSHVAVISLALLQPLVLVGLLPHTPQECANNPTSKGDPRPPTPPMRLGGSRSLRWLVATLLRFTLRALALAPSPSARREYSYLKRRTGARGPLPVRVGASAWGRRRRGPNSPPPAFITSSAVYLRPVGRRARHSPLTRRGAPAPLLEAQGGPRPLCAFPRSLRSRPATVAGASGER